MDSWPHVATELPCRDRVWGLDWEARVVTGWSDILLKSSVTIGNVRPRVTTEFLCRDRAFGLGCLARGTAHIVRSITRAMCTRQTYDNALCCALFGLLFIDTVHGHC